MLKIEEKNQSDRETLKPIILGILGYRLEHTLSPLIHSTVAKDLGLNLAYLPFEVKPEKLKDAILGMKALNFLGCNVTIPYKEEILNYVDEKSEVVEFLGAANTLIFKEDKVVAENTDWKGFIRSWEDMGMGSVKNSFAVLLGSGGAADAILYALIEMGLTKIHVFNRNQPRAERLLQKFSKKHPKLDGESFYLSDENKIALSLTNADILINATPVGMFPYIDDMPIKISGEINPNLRCYDLIYNPLKTRLVEEMEKRRHKASGGLSMLIHQAALSFEIWTGIEPDLALMKKVAYEALL